MTINWIGNFQSGYVGEVGDSVHLTRELEELGHKVQRVPQDIWKAYVDGYRDSNWDNKLPIDADINIITKWHHFNNAAYIEELKKRTEAPVFYWVWDLMADFDGMPGWHVDMVKAADLYLGNDVFSPWYKDFKNAYYFPFDCSDGDLPHYQSEHQDIDVAFFGSWVGKGDRQKWLTEINKTNPVSVFSWNYKDWPEEFNAVPPVYENRFAEIVGRCKIILGFSIEPSLYGYWSNRVGKILTLGGFLLYQYTPGMELFLKDGVEYFSSIEEAREKIDHFLIDKKARDRVAEKGFALGRYHFTSKERVKELMILAERFIKTGGVQWKV